MVDLSVASHKSGHKLLIVGETGTSCEFPPPVSSNYSGKDLGQICSLSPQNSNMNFDNMSRSLGSILLEDRTREREAESGKDALLTKSENSCLVLQT